MDLFCSTTILVDALKKDVERLAEAKQYYRRYKKVYYYRSYFDKNNLWVPFELNQHKYDSDAARVLARLLGIHSTDRIMISILCMLFKEGLFSMHNKKEREEFESQLLMSVMTND